MPTKPKITREMIEQGAVELIRRDGHEALSLRNLAAQLGCSTQPLLYQFPDAAALRRAAYRRADEYHTQYITALNREYESPMLELGMRYIRFAGEERNLFRFLFQTGEFSGRSLEELVADPQAGVLLELLSREAGIDAGQAREAFQILFAAVHGCASLMANNAMRYDEEAMRRMLEALMAGLMSNMKGEER